MTHTSLIKGPSFTTRLSPLDQRYGPFYSRRVLIFKTIAPTEQVTDTFTKALYLLAHRYPFLAGEVYFITGESPTGQQKWKEVRPAAGIELSTQDLSATLSFDELAKDNFPPAQLKHDLLIPVSLKPSPEPYNVAFFRLTYIRGGVLLGISIAHIVADGVSLSEILRSLGSFCKAAPAYNLGSDIIHIKPDGLDRSSLIGLKGRRHRVQDHPAMIKAQPGSSSVFSKTPTISEKVRVYSIGAAVLAQLKADCTDTLRTSTNDAMLALVWRAVLTARVAAGIVDPTEDPEVELYIPVSYRRLLGLSETSIGNIFGNRLITQRLSDILGPAPASMQRSAALIRTEINSIDADLCRGYVQLAESVVDPAELVWRAIPTVGSTSIAVTSLYHKNEALARQDWGDVLGGRLSRQRCSDVGYVGIVPGANFIAPGSRDGAEIQIGYPEEGLEALEADEVWRKYMVNTQ